MPPIASASAFKRMHSCWIRSYTSPRTGSASNGARSQAAQTKCRYSCVNGDRIQTSGQGETAGYKARVREGGLCAFVAANLFAGCAGAKQKEREDSHPPALRLPYCCDRLLSPDVRQRDGEALVDGGGEAGAFGAGHVRDRQLGRGGAGAREGDGA